MQTQTLVSEILCCVTLSASIALAIWEIGSQRNAGPEDRWLITRKRFVRRLVMSFCLAAIGIVMLLEIIGMVELHNVRHLVIYVSLVGFGSIILCILALADGLDTARSVREHDRREFNQNVNDHNSTTDGPSQQ